MSDVVTICVSGNLAYNNNKIVLGVTQGGINHSTEYGEDINASTSGLFNLLGDKFDDDTYYGG